MVAKRPTLKPLHPKASSPYRSVARRKTSAAGTASLLFRFPLPSSSTACAYDEVFVSTNGLLQFGNSTGATSSVNSTDNIAAEVRIAPLWDALRTDRTGDDIFVDETTPGQFTIRWDASNRADDSDVNFAATLFVDGSIRFDYGPGNTGLTPTIGISRGDSEILHLAAHDGVAELTGAPSVLFTTGPGFVDIGAFEFNGSTLDVTPPIVVQTNGLSGASPVPVTTPLETITIEFSEPVNSIDASAASNYELRSPGLNASYDDIDDVLCTLEPVYVSGTHTVTLTIVDGPLSSGEYRLTVSGDQSIHDLAGNRLDGNSDGLPGGDYVRLLNVDVMPPTAEVAGRFVFYNNSAYDNVSDDDAVAADKQALLPGQTASFQNYTSYSRGINGIMLDLANRPDRPIDVADFEFHIGNDDDPAAWPLAPPPLSLTVRPGEGVGGSDRVTIIWPDNAIQKQWLQVTVKATDATGLTAPDVFYFGNAIGESGDSATDASVGVRDQLLARLNQLPAGVELDNVYDFNRDSQVDAVDESLARDNTTSPVTALQLISVPASAAPATGPTTAESDRVHDIVGSPAAGIWIPLDSARALARKSLIGQRVERSRTATAGHTKTHESLARMTAIAAAARGLALSSLGEWTESTRAPDATDAVLSQWPADTAELDEIIEMAFSARQFASLRGSANA